MGQLEKQRAAKKAAGRGEVNNERRLDKLKTPRGEGSVSWGNAQPEWLAAIVVLVSAAGGAVRFGLSRDKGSYSLGLYLGEQTETLWFNGDSDLNDELGALYAKLQDILA